jgi:hypothetical protein
MLRMWIAVAGAPRAGEKRRLGLGGGRTFMYGRLISFGFREVTER